MAVTYADYLYNNTPNAQNLCPADLFTGSTVPRHRLRDIHFWECPVYVLDPSLQAGKKLPRWEPRSRRGIFVALSTIHASEVPLVLNPLLGVLRRSIMWFSMTGSQLSRRLARMMTLPPSGMICVWIIPFMCLPISCRTHLFIYMMIGSLTSNVKPNTATFNVEIGYDIYNTMSSQIPRPSTSRSGTISTTSTSTN